MRFAPALILATIVFSLQAQASNRPEIQYFCNRLHETLNQNSSILQDLYRLPVDDKQKGSLFDKQLNKAYYTGWTLWNNLGCEYEGPEGDE